MKKILTGTLLLIFISLQANGQQSQDTLYLKNGYKAVGKLLGKSYTEYRFQASDGVLFTYSSDEVEKIVAANGKVNSNIQEEESKTITALRFGFGLEYGFLGTNLTFYPVNRLGVFGGAGFLPYEGTHFMYNAGIKINFKPFQSSNKWGFEAMYGTNYYVIDINKIFSGVTVGFYHESDWKMFNYYFGLLYAFKGSELQDYINDNGPLESYGFPIKLAIGIGFVL
jgi:hypothetical protein